MVVSYDERKFDQATVWRKCRRPPAVGPATDYFLRPGLPERQFYSSAWLWTSNP